MGQMPPLGSPSTHSPMRPEVTVLSPQEATLSCRAGQMWPPQMLCLQGTSPHCSPWGRSPAGGGGHYIIGGLAAPHPQLQSTRCQRYTPPFVRTKNVCGLCQMSPRGKIAPDWESQFWVRIQTIFIRHNSYLNECACPCTHSVTHTTIKEKAGAAGV